MKRDVPLVYKGVRVGWATFTDSEAWEDVEFSLDVPKEEGDFGGAEIMLSCQFHDGCIYQMELIPMDEFRKNNNQEKEQ